MSGKIYENIDPVLPYQFRNLFIRHPRYVPPLVRISLQSFRNIVRSKNIGIAEYFKLLMAV